MYLLLAFISVALFAFLIFVLWGFWSYGTYTAKGPLKELLKSFALKSRPLAKMARPCEVWLQGDLRAIVLQCASDRTMNLHDISYRTALKKIILEQYYRQYLRERSSSQLRKTKINYEEFKDFFYQELREGSPKI